MHNLPTLNVTAVHFAHIKCYCCTLCPHQIFLLYTLPTLNVNGLHLPTCLLDSMLSRRRSELCTPSGSLRNFSCTQSCLHISFRACLAKSLRPALSMPCFLFDGLKHRNNIFWPSLVEITWTSTFMYRRCQHTYKLSTYKLSACLCIILHTFQH